VALKGTDRKRLESSGVADLARLGDASWAEALLDDPSSLAPGDPAEGARVFFHPKGPACYLCHTVEGRGASVGPDLSVIAKGSDARKLVESILSPSREIAPQFTPYLIARPDGTMVQGLLMVEHGDGSNLYRDADGHTFTLRADEREDVRPVATSIMPEGLSALMTPGELRDLVAFLLDPRAAEAAP
jgi:putative heme-binding domain-containing protein